ncbi:MAG: Tetratricopeptide repeat [Candidatus Eisenbacteria bacterium]
MALVSPSAVRDLFAARDLVTTGRPEQVLERLDRADAAQRDPDAIPYWVTSRALRAHAWASLGRAAAAESLVVSVLPLDPDDRAARQVLVIALLDQGKWAAAATQLDTLRAAAPGDAATRALTERLRRLAP